MLLDFVLEELQESRIVRLGTKIFDEFLRIVQILQGLLINVLLLALGRAILFVALLDGIGAGIECILG